MKEKVDFYIEELLRLTTSLKDAIMTEQQDPQNWGTILDEREEILRLIGVLVGSTDSLTDCQKDRLSIVHEMNQKLIPLMDGRKQKTQQQLNQIQRSKMATSSYYDTRPNGYGAFFDKRK